MHFLYYCAYKTKQRLCSSSLLVLHILLYFSHISQENSIFLKMCPMRFILVFLSAILAGYMAWRTVRTTPDDIDKDDYRDEKLVAKEKPETNLLKMMQNGFWVFVDMASGRYLWKNLRDINKIPS